MSSAPPQPPRANATAARKTRVAGGWSAPQLRPMRILYIGNSQTLDFQPARRRLLSAAARSECCLVEEAGITAAITRLTRCLHEEDDLPPDLVLVAQSRPGELAAADLDPLRRLAPLAIVVVILGNWCEGEGRRTSPLPGAVRIPWHRFGPEWSRHQECWRQHRCSAWELPVTASDEDRLLWATSSRRFPNAPAAGVCVDLARPGLAGDNWLAAMCRALGWQVSKAGGDPHATAGARRVGIWQTERLDGNALRHLAGFSRKVHPAPVLVIAGFPRPEDDQRVRQAGGAGLLAAPLAMEDLAAEVAWLLSGNSDT